MIHLDEEAALMTSYTNRLAAESLAAGSATAWFDRVYQAAADGRAKIPWDRGGANSMIVTWVREFVPAQVEGRALVVGCGTGDDAEFIASLGFETTAFDVAPGAIDAARLRYPTSKVDHRVADVLAPPSEWVQGFDLVLESLTIQSLPRDLRAEVAANIASFVAPGGRLVVFAYDLADEDPSDGPPWGVTRPEIEEFASHLDVVSVEQLTVPGVGNRWRAQWARRSRG